MEHWLELARGPLFAFAFLVMGLGLARHVLLQVHGLATRKGRRLRQAPWRRMASSALSWAVPVRHLDRSTLVMTTASFLFHIGAVVVPVFLAAHVALWSGFLGVRLPALGEGAADLLTVLTIVCVLVLVTYRLMTPRARALTRASDYGVLGLVLVPFLSGFLAAHPTLNPLPWSGMMLLHILSAELLLVAIPFTKLAHVVLFPFDRLSEVHWQLRPGAGDRVAAALYGEEAHV
jgi:nitrate reductase gamma subunit